MIEEKREQKKEALWGGDGKKEVRERWGKSKTSELTVGKKRREGSIGRRGETWEGVGSGGEGRYRGVSS